MYFISTFFSVSLFHLAYTSDVIARSQIDLLQVASEIGSDWPKLIEFLLPQSHLNSSCTVNQLVNWINENEPKWQIKRNQLAMEMGKITGENDGGDVVGSFGGPISVNELRTIQDQALAVLLAWREENGDSATGMIHNNNNSCIRQVPLYQL